VPVTLPARINNVGCSGTPRNRGQRLPRSIGRPDNSLGGETRADDATASLEEKSRRGDKSILWHRRSRMLRTRRGAATCELIYRFHDFEITSEHPLFITSAFSLAPRRARPTCRSTCRSLNLHKPHNEARVDAFAGSIVQRSPDTIPRSLLLRNSRQRGELLVPSAVKPDSRGVNPEWFRREFGGKERKGRRLRARRDLTAIHTEDRDRLSGGRACNLVLADARETLCISPAHIDTFIPRDRSLTTKYLSFKQHPGPGSPLCHIQSRRRDADFGKYRSLSLSRRQPRATTTPWN